MAKYNEKMKEENELIVYCYMLSLLKIPALLCKGAELASYHSLAEIS